MQNPLLNKGKFERGFSTAHLGVDWSSWAALPIYPADKGIVSDLNEGCDNNGFYGNTCGNMGGNWIEIDHGNGIKTRYLHLAKVNVKLGQSVFPKTILGILGNSGSSTGPHLHFEIMKNEVRQDPLPYLDGKTSQDSEVISNRWLGVIFLLFLALVWWNRREIINFYQNIFQFKTQSK